MPHGNHTREIEPVRRSQSPQQIKAVRYVAKNPGISTAWITNAAIVDIPDGKPACLEIGGGVIRQFWAGQIRKPAPAMNQDHNRMWRFALGEKQFTTLPKRGSVRDDRGWYRARTRKQIGV
jgi:hypothetical protein